jgi:hypothetical protein
MAAQPLALQWLCIIRDHGTDLKVTQGERALASLLPTYGQGQHIFVSMHSLAAVTGWSRNTVKKHRDGLIAKGLLEDITGDPDRLLRTYRLTMPDYVTQGGSDIDLGMGQILTQGGSNIDPNIKSEIKPEINTTSSADDVSGAAGEPLDLDLLANILGVDSLRSNIVSLANSLADSYGAAVVLSVAEKCRASARNPAGLFVSSAKDMCEQHVANVQKASEPTWVDEYHAQQDAKKAEHERRMAEARTKSRHRRAA